MLNSRFVDYLNGFKINGEVQELYYYVLEDVIKLDDTQRDKERIQIQEQINLWQARLNNLHDNFNDQLIVFADYSSLKSRYENALNDLVIKHATLAPKGAGFKKYIAYSLSLLADIGDYYEKAELPVKQKIIGSIFPEKLIIEKGSYRTTKINEVFGLIASIDADSKKQQPDISVGLSSWAPLTGQFLNQLSQDLEAISELPE